MASIGLIKRAFISTRQSMGPRRGAALPAPTIELLNARAATPGCMKRLRFGTALTEMQMSALVQQREPEGQLLPTLEIRTIGSCRNMFLTH